MSSLVIMDDCLFLLVFQDFGLTTSSHGDTLEQAELIDPITDAALDAIQSSSNQILANLFSCYLRFPVGPLPATALGQQPVPS
jgi:hypothetical protein